MKSFMLLPAVMLCAASASAQMDTSLPQRGGMAGAGRVQPQSGATQVSAPFTRSLISPELVMTRQREIGLRDEQRATLSKEMSVAQAKFTEVQWSLSAEQAALEALLVGPVVDEAAVLKTVDRILMLEQDLKRTQMTLLVRVKNALTPQQQALLSPMMGAGGRGGVGAGRGAYRGAGGGRGAPPP